MVPLFSSIVILTSPILSFFFLLICSNELHLNFHNLLSPLCFARQPARVDLSNPLLIRPDFNLIVDRFYPLLNSPTGLFSSLLSTPPPSVFPSLTPILSTSVLSLVCLYCPVSCLHIGFVLSPSKYCGCGPENKSN